MTAAHATVQVHEKPERSATGLSTRKLGMWLFLANEVMLFSGLIGALLNAKGRSPATANDVLNIPVTAANTFVLIVSSTAVVMALSAMQDGDLRKTRFWLLATAILGALFVGVQVIEYSNLIREGFVPSLNIFASAFFTVTGLHGTHVAIGVLWVVGLLVNLGRGKLPAGQSMPIEIFGLYWHFVDVVWILLFTIIYLL